MKLQKYLFVFILLILSNSLFSFSPKVESFFIRNNSSKDVVLNIEFQEGIRGQPEYNYIFEQTVSDLILLITDMQALFRNNIVRPNRDFEIIKYFPLENGKYEIMYTLPFMDKMNAIFKNLEIICNDGNTIITLENLGERFIKKVGGGSGGSITYILEIFDYDFEVRRASEW